MRSVRTSARDSVLYVLLVLCTALDMMMASADLRGSICWKVGGANSKKGQKMLAFKETKNRAIKRAHARFPVPHGSRSVFFSLLPSPFLAAAKYMHE